MIIATAGHVDHGKTTLVHALTGIDTDRLADEQERGLTIELGFAYCDHADQRWGFIDVPGHQRFIGNMLAGVAAIDAALLVVAADEGPMPQTLEHLQILELLGVSQAVVALTRADRASAEQCATTEAAVRELLAPTALAEASCIAVSAVTGEGMEALQAALQTLAPLSAARVGQHFRLSVDRAFSVAGSGLVVTGTAHAGQVNVGDTLVLLPRGEEVRVRSLRALDQERRQGHAGERLALNLVGSERDHVGRGDWLCAPEIAAFSRRFDARLQPLAGTELRNGQEVHLHHGASHSLARLSVLDDGRYHVAVREPLAILHGDRFIVRDSSARETLAGGWVLDPSPPQRGRRKPQRLAELDALETGSPEAIIRELLALRPLELDLNHWAWRLNQAPERLRAALPDALHQGALARDQAAWQALLEDIRGQLGRYHAGQPQLAGMDAAQIRAVLEPRPDRSTLEAALRDAIQAGLLARTATHFHLPGHQPRLTRADEQLWGRVRPHLQAQPLQPPVVHNLARELELAPEELEAFLIRAHHAGVVTRVAGNRFLLPAAVAQLAATVETLAASAPDGAFDARAFRDAAGIGRNLSIDLLEYFDRMKLTRRFGDVRRQVGDAETLFGAARRNADCRSD